MDSEALITLKKPDRRSWHVAFAFTVNYILGFGILGLPFAFVKAGLLLSPLFLIFVTLLSAVSLVWYLEVQARAGAYARALQYGGVTPSPKMMISVDDSSSVFSQVPQGGGAGRSWGKKGMDPGFFQIGNQIYEIPQLCFLFFGKIGEYLYTVCVVVYLYGALWSYVAVVGQTLAMVVPMPGLTVGNIHTCNLDTNQDVSPNCNYAYTVYVCLFGFIVTPVSCLELKEQKILQISITIFRFIVLLFIIGSTTAAIFTLPLSMGKVLEQSDTVVLGSYDNQSSSYPYISQNVPLATVTGLSQIFTTAIYAQLIHHSIPGLSHLVKNKLKLKRVFLSVLATTLGWYLVVGMMVALYFGEYTTQTMTLLWLKYVGGWSGSSSWWTYLVSYIVVLFPVIDIMISAFPLSAVTLGNNIYSSLPVKWRNHPRGKIIKIFCRLIAAVPPLIIGVFVHSLTIIKEIVGLPGFFIAFIFPALLQIKSKYLCNKIWGTSETPYTWHFSHIVYCVLVLLFAVTAFLWSLAQIIWDLLKK